MVTNTVSMGTLSPKDVDKGANKVRIEIYYNRYHFEIHHESYKKTVIDSLDGGFVGPVSSESIR